VREEKITLSIVKWLKAAGWEIICIDFPQSGTGTVVHPNADIRLSTKNLGGIIPDILAVKGDDSIYFENKDRFYYDDFEKLRNIKESNMYSEGLLKLIVPRSLDKMIYAIGGPDIDSFTKRSMEYEHMVDMLVVVKENGEIKPLKGNLP
jgi:hypothetical protein